MLTRTASARRGGHSAGIPWRGERNHRDPDQMGREPQIEMIVGRAKTVLVFAGQAAPVATITAILARWDEVSSAQGVVFSGPVRFADDTQRHLRATVLPLVQRLCQSLGLALGSFEVSAVNLAAASHLDLGLEISGFSADLPLFLALLSARLGLPVPQDVVCTGHIASSDGDVRMVQNLPAKLDAARTDRSIQRILLPGPDADGSLASAANGALVQIAADFLAGSRQRFYDALDAVLMAGNGKLARRLLRGWVDLHIARKRYPREFGQTLAGILQPLPPAVLRTELAWPLLPVSACIALSQHALPRDARDVPELYEAVSKPPQPHARARLPERGARCVRDRPHGCRGRRPRAPARRSAALRRGQGGTARQRPGRRVLEPSLGDRTLGRRRRVQRQGPPRAPERDD